MADSKSESKVRRKSARVALNISFSKFKNTVNDPLIVDASVDADTEKPQCPPKTDIAAPHNSDDDFATPLSKIRKVTEKAQLKSHISQDLEPKTTAAKKIKTIHGKRLGLKLVKGEKWWRCVREMGFGSLLSLDIDTIPAKLGRLIKRWRIYLGYEKVKVRPNHIVQHISSSAVADLKFKLNFIVLFASIMGRCYTNGDCYLKLLKKIDSNTLFGDIDWSGYIIESLKSSRDEWKPDGRHFCGPLTVLVLIYVDRVAYRTLNVTRDRRAIEVWTTEKLKARETADLACGGFGMGEILDRVQPIEAENQVHAFLTMEPNARESTSAPEKIIDVKDLVLKLRSYMKMIKDGQTGFQETLMVAKESFAEDVEIQDLESEFTSILGRSHGKDNKKSGSFTDVGDVDVETDKSHGLRKGVGHDKDLQIVVTPHNGKQSESSKGQECVEDLSDSQFWVHLLVLSHVVSAFKPFENVGSAFANRGKELHVSGFATHSDDIPSFSLGLTQEFETNRENCELTVFKGPVDGEQSREVNPMPDNCNKEQMISDWIFAMQGDKLDFVFSTKYGLDVPKLIFESFVANEFLFVNVIDIWSKILNNEERFRNRFSPVRLFCPTLTDTLLDGQKSYESFKDDISVAAMFNKELTDLKPVDFIFFPIQRNNHIYLMVFNLKNSRWLILDNIACDDVWKAKDLVDRYGGLPDKVRWYLRRLSDVENPKWKSLMKTAPRRLKMKCQTTWNGVDCGVFVMR